MNLYYLTLRDLDSDVPRFHEWSHSKLDLIDRGQRAIRAHMDAIEAMYLESEDLDSIKETICIAQVRVIEFTLSGTVRQFVVDILNRSPITKKSILVWSLESEKRRRKEVLEISPIVVPPVVDDSDSESESDAVSLTRHEAPMISPIGISPVI